MTGAHRRRTQTGTGHRTRADPQQAPGLDAATHKSSLPPTFGAVPRIVTYHSQLPDAINWRRRSGRVPR